MVASTVNTSKFVIAVVAATALIVVDAIADAGEVYDFAGFIQSVILGVLCTFVIADTVKQQRVFSPIFFLACLFLQHYSIPGIYFSIIGLYANPDNAYYSSEALNYIIVFFIALAVFDRWINAKSLQTSKQDLYCFNDRRLAWTISVFVLIGLVIKYVIISNNVYFQVTRTSAASTNLDTPFFAFIMFFESLPLFSLVLALIHYYSTGSKIWKKVFIALFIIEFVYWVPTGRKEEVLNLLTFPIVIRFIFSKRLPALKHIVPLAITAFLIFPLTKYFREAIGYGIVENSTLGFNDLGSIITDNVGYAVEDFLLENEDFLRDREKYATVVRFSHIEEFAGVVRLTKDEGFKYGDTYGYFPLAFIPRYFWPDKPVLAYGNDFGKTIGLIAESDDLTSVNVSLPAEAYWNFGALGFIVLLFPFLLAELLYNNIKRGRYKAGAVLLYMVLLKTFLYLGGDFNAHYSGLIKIAMFFIVIILILRQKRNLCAVSSE